MALTNKQKLIKFFTPIILPVVKTYWKVFKPETNGVKIIVENNKKFLIIKNSYGNKRWTFPGGSVDKGEKPQEAAKRELREETGLKLYNIEFIDKIVSTSEGKIDNIYIFYGKSNTEEISLDEFEIETGDWFRPDSPPELSPIAKRIWEVFRTKKL